MTHRYTAYFCGCLTANNEVSTRSLIDAGWKQEENKEMATYQAKHIYYDEFLNFCSAKTPQEGCVAWRYEMKEDERVGTCKNLLDQVVIYLVPALHCYILPFGIVIFAIEVTAVDEVMDNFISIAVQLRRLAIPQGVADVLRKLKNKVTGNEQVELSEALDYGYKLKVFQIIDSDAAWNSETNEERKQVLFRLGVIQSNKSTISTRFQDGYEEGILNQHSISVFNNWDALALLDSFTIRSMQCEDWQMKEWQNAFFRMIYIQSLFQKFYLQSLNQRFRAMVEHRSKDKLANLLAEFEHYERICQFNKVSYTFLPLLIDNAIDTSLEIKEERDLLSTYIKGEEKRHESDNERRINRLLLAISCLTMFSAIWDLSSLMNEILPYNCFFCSTRRGYAIISSGLLIIVLVLIAFIYIMGKSRNRKRDQQ